MNFNGRYLRKSTNEEGRTEIAIELNSYQDDILVRELEKGALYRITAVPVKSKRSIEQNKLMWEVIHEIAIAECGENATSADDWDIYIQSLEQAQARFEIVLIKEEAVPMLADSFRAYKVLNTIESPNGWTMAQVKVFYGSSKLDVKEMGKLLDVVIQRAYDNGISLKYYD